MQTGIAASFWNTNQFTAWCAATATRLVSQIFIHGLCIKKIKIGEMVQEWGGGGKSRVSPYLSNSSLFHNLWDPERYRVPFSYGGDNMANPCLLQELESALCRR